MLTEYVDLQHMLDWQTKSFAELTTYELYSIFALRQQVFILEQRCIYPDIDEIDMHCVHLFANQESPSAENDLGNQARLAAYLRVIAPRTRQSSPSLGRIVIAEQARGHGTGRALVLEGIRYCETRWPKAPITISAQDYLRDFYASLGFEPTSDVYDEDGIPHLDMRRPAAS